MTTPAGDSGGASADVDTFPLATTQWGNPSVRVLLIHGLADGAFVWNAFLRCLRGELGGLCVDLRGHGDSPWDPLQSYATDALAADVVQLTDCLDLSPLVLVGHSLGAEVATRVAAARPARIAGLVLVEGGPELDQKAAYRMRQEVQAMPRKYDSVAQLEALLSERYPIVDPATLGRYAAGALRPTASGLLELKHDPAILNGMRFLKACEFWSLLAGLHCPTLLVRGRLSSLLSRERLASFPSECLSVTGPSCRRPVTPYRSRIPRRCMSR